MVYFFDYDVSYDPALPVVEIEVASGMNEPGIALRAIVDSGADATIVPLRHLHQVAARIGRRAWMRGVTHDRVPIDRYRLWVRVGGLRPVYLNVVADRQGDETILGRDALNQWLVTLNGPASTVEIST